MGSVRENLLATRQWYRRQVNKPWEEDEFIKISVKGDLSMTNVAPIDYSSEESTALVKIYDFYGKIPPATAAGNITGVDSHFYQRPMMRPLLLYSIPKVDVVSATKKSAGRDPQILTADLADLAYSRSYSLAKFDKQIAEISDIFEAFQTQSKIFDGSTKPSINFIQDYNKLVIAQKKIKSFIRFNGLQYRTDEADKVRIEFAADYRIVNIILVQGAVDKYLFKGSMYFLQDTPGLQDLRVNRLLSQLNEIHRLKKEPELITWTEFINKFLPDVEVNFFGRPHTWMFGSGQRTAGLLGVGKPYSELEEKVKDREKLKDPWVQAQLLREAMKKSPDRKAADKKLQKAAEKMKEAAAGVELVREFISHWGIDTLIFAALECLALRSGMAVDSIPPIPGLNPYDIMPKPIIIKMPKMSFEMPTVDYLKSLGEMALKGVKGAAYEALMAVTQTLAEILLSMCQEGGDEEEITESTPINELIDLYLEPSEKEKPGHEQTCLEASYEQSGINSPEDGNLFLSYLAQRITPRETCDLLNSAPNEPTLEIVKNVLAEIPELATVNAVLTSDNEIIEFFTNIGRCISSDYCEAVYAESPIDLSGLDPCTVEEMLVAQTSPNVFDALMDALNNADELMADAIPDMGCGAGIMPAYADIPVLNYSITNALINLFEPPATAFINDISLLKDILLVPSATCRAGTGQGALLQALADEDLIPNPGPKRNEDGETEPRMDADQLEDLLKLFPQQVKRSPQIRNLIDIIKGGAEEDPTVVSCANTSITYEVAPQYKENLATLDARLETPYTRHASSLNYGHMYFSIMMPNFKDPMESPTIYFSPGQVPAGSGGGPGYISVPPGTPHVLRRQTLDFYYTGIEVYTQAQLVSQNPGAFFDCSLDQTNFEVPTPTNLYDGQGNVVGTTSASPCEGRELSVDKFRSIIFGDFFSRITTHQTVKSVFVAEQFGNLNFQAFGDLYFPAYTSLFNSIAFNVRNSKLFKVYEINRLGLLPIPCPNGGVVGTDLFDINSIIQDALDEFKENSCSDKTCAIGPVEDAIIYAALNAYIQILLLEQLLKNIFLLDAYGLGSFFEKDSVINNIIAEMYVSIGAKSMEDMSLAAQTQSAQTISTGGVRESTLEQGRMRGRNMLTALYSAAIIYVDKLRIRTTDPGTGEVPEWQSPTGLGPVITGMLLPDPTVATASPIVIPDNVMSQINSRTSAAKQIYGQYAFEYMVRKRLSKLAPKINELFDKPVEQGAPNSNFLLYGMPEVDVLHVPAGDAVSIYDQEQPVRMWQSADDAVPVPGEAFGDATFPTFELRITGSNIAEETINYDYGLNLEERGFMKDTISSDEVEYAKGHGVFVRENYVKLKVNMRNLETMLNATSLTPADAPYAFSGGTPAADKHSPDSDSPCIDAVRDAAHAAWDMMQDGTINLEGLSPVDKQRLAEQGGRVKDWLFDGGLLPPPATYTVDPTRGGTQTQDFGTYVYPTQDSNEDAEGFNGWSDMVVGVEQFNSFINTVRREDTSPNPTLDNVRVTYIVETVIPDYMNEYDHFTGGNASKGGTKYFPFDSGLGCQRPDDFAPGKHFADSEGQAAGQFDEGYMARASAGALGDLAGDWGAQKAGGLGRIGASHYHAVQGPLKKSNYDAIRFWLREVVNPSLTNVDRQQGPYSQVEWEMGIGTGLGPCSVSPSVVSVGWEAADTWEGTSYRKAKLRRLSIPIIDRWGATFDGTGMEHVDGPVANNTDSMLSRNPGAASVEQRYNWNQTRWARTAGVDRATPGYSGASVTGLDSNGGEINDGILGTYQDWPTIFGKNPYDGIIGSNALSYRDVSYVSSTSATARPEAKKVYKGGSRRTSIIRKQLGIENTAYGIRDPDSDDDTMLSALEGAYDDLRGRISVTWHGNARGMPARDRGVDLWSSSGTDMSNDYRGAWIFGQGWDKYCGTGTTTGLTEVGAEYVYDPDRRNNPYHNQFRNGLVQYRLRKSDLFESDYNQAIWTGFDINTLRGYTKNYFGSDGLYTQWSGAERGNEAERSHATGPAWWSADGDMERWSANSGYLTFYVDGGASSPSYSMTGRDTDGYGIWAKGFFAYPTDFDNVALWSQLLGPDGEESLADADEDRRRELAGTFFSDEILSGKLLEAYTNGAVDLASPTSPRTSVPAPLAMAPWQPIERAGAGSFTDSRWFDPRVSSSGFAGLQSGHFRVVAITLGGADSAVKQISASDEIQDLESWNIEGIETLIKEHKWEEFKQIMDPTPPPTANPLQPGDPGYGLPNLCDEPEDGDCDAMIDCDIVTFHLLTPEQMMANWETGLLNQSFSSDRNRWPRGSEYLTGDKGYDSAINRVIRDFRAGARIAYQSPVLENSDPVLIAMAENRHESYDWRDAFNDYEKNKSGLLIKADGGKILSVNTGIQGEHSIATRVGGFTFSSYTRDLTALGGGREGDYIDTRIYDVIRPYLKLDSGPGKKIIHKIVSPTKFAAYELDADGNLMSDSDGLLIPSSTGTQPNLMGLRYQELFNGVYDTDALLQYMFMVGLRSSNMLSDKFTIMFNDTKQSVRTILRAALAGDNYAHRDPESSSSSNISLAAAMDLGAAAALLPFMDMGSSFVQKMLLETPIRILKGLAEMIDPHVVIGKMIRDISGQVIDQVEQYANLGKSIAQTTAAMSGAPPLEGRDAANADKTIREWIQEATDETFADLPPVIRPKIGEASGIDLIGTFPYFLAIPPGPLGIAYILLSLQHDKKESANFTARAMLAGGACADARRPSMGALPKTAEEEEVSAQAPCAEPEADPDGIPVLDELPGTETAGGGDCP